MRPRSCTEAERMLHHFKRLYSDWGTTNKTKKLQFGADLRGAIHICESLCTVQKPNPLTPYLFSMGRLYSSQSYALAWGGDGASPQVTALCFGIFGTRVPFFWFWLPGKGGEHIKVITDVWLAYLKFSTVHCSCWPYLRCCCYLCLSCCVSLLCCDRGSGCRG